MFFSVLSLILRTWVVLLFLRLFLQRAGLHRSHPLANLCATMTDFIVKPMRRIFPPMRGWDSAIIFVAFLALFLYQLLYLIISLFMISNQSTGFMVVFSHWLIFTPLNVLIVMSQCVAYALIILLVIQMVLSFSDPYNPLMAIISRIISPLTRPFSLLRIGQFDFSPTVVFLILWYWVSILSPQLISRLF